MTQLSRRAALLGTGSVIVGSAIPSRTAAAAPAPAIGPEQTVRSNDSRYRQLMTGNNQRFVANPEYFRILRSTADAEQSVRAAVEANKRISVRSGGHCFADLVCNPEVDAVLDLSGMNHVSY